MNDSVNLEPKFPEAMRMVLRDRDGRVLHEMIVATVNSTTLTPAFGGIYTIHLEPVS